MKLDRIDEYVTTAVAIVVGVAISYWCGLLAGGGELGTLFAFIGGLLFVSLLLGMRQQVWMLIPITWAFIGQLPEVKFTPALRDVVIFGVATATFLLVAFKVVRYKPKFQLLDFMVWATLLYLAITWLRNPVGGLVLNSERIGGRPYMNTFVAMVGFWVLSRSSITSPNWANAFLGSFVVVRVGHALLSVIANYWTSAGEFMVRFYRGIDVSTVEEGAYTATGEGTGRKGYLQGLGEPVLRWLFSYFRPIDVVNPLLAMTTPFLFFRFLLVLVLTFFVLQGGFRSNLLLLICFFLTSTWVQQGWRAAVKGGLILACLLTVIVMMSPVIRYPLAVQRSLSFLPGEWDPMAKVEAQMSSEWRFYMWRQMLFTNRYIENKWLGDGFGFSGRQMQLMASVRGAGQGGLQETYLIVGQVHSGPISAIRYVGYIGCLGFIILLSYMARRAFKLARRAQGTPYRLVTLFFCVPIIFQPANFILIFGSYDYDLPEAIFAAGMLKMLMNTLDRYEALKPAEEDQPAELAAPLRPQRQFHRPRRPALAQLPPPALG
jgi:hypothetical protein